MGPIASRQLPHPFRRVLFALVAACFLAVTAAYGLFHLFATFQWYDDEGYLLLAVRFVSRGQTLYDTISTPYGPFYFLYEHVLHDLFRVPLTHAATRWITLAHWIAIASLCAAIVRRITSSTPWALAAYGTSFLAVRALANEPGHPQELCALVVAAIPLLAWDDGWIERRGTVIALGIAAALATVKINVGVFCIAACGTMLVIDASRFTPRRALGALAVLGGAVSPFVLMSTSLADGRCLRYAIAASLGIVGTTLVLLANRRGGADLLRRSAWFALGLAVGLAAPFAFASAGGSTVHGLLHSITDYLGTQMYYPSMCPPYLARSVRLACGAVLLCAAWLVWPQSRVVGGLIAFCKTVYAVAALSGVSRLGGTQATLLTFTPWVWIWTLPYPSASSTDGRGAVRAFLALLAAWHVLLPFPVAGSQVAFGTFLLTAVGGVLCAFDVCVWIAAGLRQGERRLVTAAGAVLALVVFGEVAVGAWSLRLAYHANVALDLPGTDGMRLPAREAELYQQFVAAVAPVDVFFATWGMNSLYIWTDREPSIPALVTEDLRLLSPAQQALILRRLREARSSLVLAAPSPFGAVDADQPLVRAFRDDYEQVGSFYPFVRLLRPKR